MTKLIVCCDGTWNSPDQEDNGIPAPTNVVKLHAALAEKDVDGTIQKRFYRAGVGTRGGIIRRAWDGGVGDRLSDDIKSAYKWLCDNYEPEDEIFIFGFSRGAFAARSLTGLMDRCGLLAFAETDLSERDRWARLQEAYDNYRSREKNLKWKGDYDRHTEVKISFLGVWDTVGALGIPDELAISRFDKPEMYRFHNTKLSQYVETARHALAIDERRRTFTPTLWDDEPVIESTVEMPRIKQVWFAGAHGDVGGSYADCGLGDIALKWMLDEAEQKGLVFESKMTDQIDPDPSAVLHNSHKGIFAKLRTRPRSVPCLDRDSDNLHSSVQKRRANPPIRQANYWPTEHPSNNQAIIRSIRAKEHWNATGIFLKAGESYDFSASGEWLDASIKCTPDGALPGPWYKRLAYATVGPANWLQGRRRSRVGQERAIVRFAKREQNMPWFCLIGTIANSSGVHLETQEFLANETFRIGSGRTFTPDKDGYLYCYANDIWDFYGNNKGRVTLSVTPVV